MNKVLACIALLAAALMIYGFKKLLEPGPHSGPHDRVLDDFTMIGARLKNYKRETGHYPTTEQGLEALVKRPASDPQPAKWIRLADPIPRDPWGQPYQYRFLPGKEPEEFEITCSGKDGVLGTKDDRSSLDYEH